MSPQHAPHLRLVSLQPKPSSEARLGVRMDISIRRSPYGRSRVFQLRPRDIGELIRIAEAMERRR
jgi:hypothetical protein